LTNSAWRILADFHIRSGGFEKKYLATLVRSVFVPLVKGANANWELNHGYNLPGSHYHAALAPPGTSIVFSGLAAAVCSAAPFC
jgi:hypothetical protein